MENNERQQLEEHLSCLAHKPTKRGNQQLGKRARSSFHACTSHISSQSSIPSEGAATPHKGAGSTGVVHQFARNRSAPRPPRIDEADERSWRRAAGFGHLGPGSRRKAPKSFSDVCERAAATVEQLSGSRNASPRTPPGGPSRGSMRTVRAGELGAPKAGSGAAEFLGSASAKERPNNRGIIF